MAHSCRRMTLKLTSSEAFPLYTTICRPDSSAAHRAQKVASDMAIRRRHIGQLAERILDEIGCQDPPVGIRKIAKLLGTRVEETPADEGLSGFLLRGATSDDFVIGVNAKQSASRKRFTIAHECGHFLLHGGEAFHVDGVFQINRRDDKSSTGSEESEIEANLFAAELLMPRRFLARDLDAEDQIDLLDDEAIKAFAKRYRVSVQAMTLRLTNLDYISL